MRRPSEVAATLMEYKEAISKFIHCLNGIIELKKLEEEIALEETRELEQVRAESSLAVPEVLRLEVNRLKFPIFALNDKDVRRRKAIDYQVVIKKGDERIQLGWQVRGDTVFGLPGPFDKKVDFVIQEIINEMKPPIRVPIVISTFEFCRRMGLKPGGSIYKKIHQSLMRLLGISVTSEGIFYLKTKRERIFDAFHLYDRVVLRDEHLPDDQIADSNYIWPSRYFLENINHGYTKPLDWRFYKSLKSQIAQRLYEVLGVKFYGVIKQGGVVFNIEYHELCAVLPLKPRKEIRYAKRQLKRAHEELVLRGYLKEFKWQDWVICYSPGPRVFEEYKKSQEAVSSFRLAKPKDEEKQARLSWLVEELKRRLDDPRGEHIRYYWYIARRVPEDLILACLTDVELDEREGKIDYELGQSKAKLFTFYLKQSCEMRGIRLEFKSEEG